jgi:LacI family transcriptional regulator
MKHVALIIETSRTYGREILLGVKKYVNENSNWSMFLELRDLDSGPPPWLKNWKGDGILTRSGNSLTAQAIAEAGVPTVELRATRLGTNFPYVGVDNVKLGRDIAYHFIDRGFRNFAIYELDTEVFFVERRNSFCDTVRSKGYESHSYCQPPLTEKPGDWEQQQDSLLKWLKDLPKPVGILACTDQLGYWLLDACRRANLRVPEEIAVVGVENDECLCEMSTPPLSSMRLGGERIGYHGAYMLHQMMEGQPLASTSTYFEPSGIIVRQSSDIIAINDRWISNALSLIRREACQKLSVEEILDEIPVSRSKLERDFRRFLGRTPNEEINRVRLEKVKDLLRDTDLSIEQISQRTGFTRPHYLHALFQKNFGKTPGEFRKSFNQTLLSKRS